MKEVAIISGIGLVTPLGRSADQTWDSLLAGQFITNHARVEPADHFDFPRVVSLATEAADQAITKAKRGAKSEANWGGADEQTALICCTSKGSVEEWMSRRYCTEAYGLADLSTLLARRFGFNTGPRLTLSAACAGGLHGLIRAVMMIQNGEARRVLVVAAEASVHPLFLGSFNRLGVLPAEGELCRPFDKNRSGFLMSEAAAAICVEAMDVANISTPQIAIDRFAMGGDATHLTGSDPHGRVLKHLLKQTIGYASLDLFHAHGTGTVANDSTELLAMESVLRDQPHDSRVSLYSHKAALGHSLGASGLVAVAINCLCHQHGQVPPNINTIDPIELDHLRIDRQVIRRGVHRSAIHAAGFGGPTAVVTLSSLGM